MSISVASRRIDRLHSLSKRARLVLGLVEGGIDWVEWAIHHREARYHFADEAGLVAAVQSGLHSAYLLFLPHVGLIASPDKLMTLETDELRLLARARHSNQDPARRGEIRAMLERHGLFPAAEIEAAGRFLDGLGIGDFPLFQAMDLGDRLALIQLSVREEGREPLGAGLKEEAALFALERAANVPEFVDYFRAYLSFVAKAGLASRPPRDRLRRSQQAVAALVPLLFHALDCPSVDRAAARDFVPAAVTEWLEMGRRVGFLRISQGVQQVIAHSRFPEATLSEAQAIVAGYIDGAQVLLMSAALHRLFLTQDGETVFHAHFDHREVFVTLGRDRVITLTAYRHVPPRHPFKMEESNG